MYDSNYSKFDERQNYMSIFFVDLLFVVNIVPLF
jgi:hypothetical protein